MTQEDELAKLRQQIDQIDLEILQQLKNRAECAIKVGEIKKRASGGDISKVEFYRPDREKLVLERIKKLNNSAISNEKIEFIFREIMSICLSLELPLKIAYLGPEGTFSQMAAKKHFGNAAIFLGKKTIEDVFRSVEDENADFGVVPIENSTEGTIGTTLDQLANTSLFICGETLLKIEQNLMSKELKASDIKKIYSHPQSLAQCRNFLLNKYPEVEIIAQSSNAQAAQHAAQEKNAAAIAGVLAAEKYQLNIIEKNIADRTDNCTRFAVIGRNNNIKATGKDKTSLLLCTQNRPGALFSLLIPIDKAAVNMTKIESRPNPQGLWEYFFFIDIDGHKDEEKIHNLCNEIEKNSGAMRILGSYPKAELI